MNIARLLHHAAVACALPAILILLATPAAAAPPPAFSQTRDELLNRWDLNKDGRIDDSEAEVARSKMRRERLEMEEKVKNGKPPMLHADSAGPATRGNGSGHGSGVQPQAGAGSLTDPLSRAFLPANDATAPVGGGAQQPSRHKAEPPTQTPAPELNAGRPRGEIDEQSPAGPLPRSGRPSTGNRTGGVVTGGTRAGAPALRPGYGAGGPKVDLNAGRLPGGLPPAQGIRPQVGAAPFRAPAAGQVQRGTALPARTGTALPSRAGTALPSRTGAAPRPFLPPSSPPRITAEDIGAP